MGIYVYIYVHKVCIIYIDKISNNRKIEQGMFVERWQKVAYRFTQLLSGVRARILVHFSAFVHSSSHLIAGPFKKHLLRRS